MSDLAVITGGARRLGAAITQSLAADGCDVLIHANKSIAQADELAGSLSKEFSVQASAIQADLADKEGLEAFCTRIVDRDPLPKYLVLSAANFLRKRLPDTSVQEWNDVHFLNLRAPALIGARVGQAMANQGGSIVIVSDAAGLAPWPNYAAHSIAKSGLTATVQVLAKQLAPNVTVNAVAPGPVLFPEHFSEADVDAATKYTVLRRAGSTADICKAVRYLCFDAPYVTGTVLPVDGGRHLLGMPDS